jgi:hypothetical protein
MSDECPPGLVFDPMTLFCVLPEPTTPTETPTATPTPDDRCPEGFFWNPNKGHCDSRECPPALVFDEELLYCVIPPTPSPTPVDQSCPEGFFWHPAMGHCMSNECPPGLVFDPVTLFCVLPEPAPPVETPTATPEPSCPEGFFWNPNKGHCDSRECPPGFVFDKALLYCVPAPAPPTEPPQPTETPLPECPGGFFWHPAMGHCMSEECPPGLVFDRETLFCVLPP